MQRKPMLRHENPHRDKNCKREDQSGCPNATAPRREIARAVAVRQFARRCGSAAGRRPPAEVHLAEVLGSAVAGLRKAGVPSDRAGAAEGFRAAQACPAAEHGEPRLIQASIPSFDGVRIGNTRLLGSLPPGSKAIKAGQPDFRAAAAGKSGKETPGLS
jgi:hypothetical protein